MTDAQLFIDLARQQGYGADAARAALKWVHAQLVEHGEESGRYYMFRSSGEASSGGAGGTTAARPRLVLAFRSPDAALSFAQQGGLGVAPRLVALPLGQLLAVLIQRPAIGALYIADEDTPPSSPGNLPSGLRIERTALLNRLQSADCSFYNLQSEDGCGEPL